MTVTHVAIDTVGARINGAAIVALSTVSSAIAHPSIGRVTVFASPDREFAWPPSPKLRVIEERAATDSSVARLRWQLRGLQRAAADEGADVVLGMSNGVVRHGDGPPTVLFIQQGLPFDRQARAVMPLAFRARLYVIRELMRASAHSASRVVVQTHWMAAEITRAFRVPEDRLIVMTPGPPDFVSSASNSRALQRVEATAPGRRLLYVGNDLPYKNLATLTASIAALRSSHPDTVLLTVLPEGHPIASPSVICLGILERDEMRRLYRACDALVMPSLCESLGLPLLEAMQLGVPIVAADRAYAREVCEDAALFASPLSSSAMASAIANVLDDKALRDRLIARGRALDAKRAAAKPYETLWDQVVGLACRA